jgi:hypothetical protein
MSRGSLWLGHTYTHTHTNCRTREGKRDDTLKTGTGMCGTHTAERWWGGRGHVGRRKYARIRRTGTVMQARKKGKGMDGGKLWKRYTHTHAHVRTHTQTALRGRGKGTTHAGQRRG